MMAKGAGGLDKDGYQFLSGSEWHGLKHDRKMK
jgi:hypothetical protein